MRAPTILLATAAIAVAALPGRADAASAVLTGDVNVRAGPGSEYPVVTTFGSRANVEVFGCLEGGTWCDVGGADGRGWVSGDFLAASGGSAPLQSSGVQVSVTTYEPATYWDTHYADRDFYTQRDQFAQGGTVVAQSGTTTQGGGGALTGAASGAAVGAIVGGPVGAVVGGIAGGAAGAAIDPPQTVTTYVTSNAVEPVRVEGEVVVGAGLPEAVVLHRVPDYEYEYAYVNGQAVLVDPGTRRVVYVVR